MNLRNIGFVQFQQSVSVTPYVWLDAVVQKVEEAEGNAEDDKRSRKIRGLSTHSSILDSHPTTRVYDPFEVHPSLFTHFHNVKLDELSIKKFADKYGLLGVQRPAEVDGTPYQVEDFDDWARAIRDVKKALKLYETFQSFDSGGLNRSVEKTEQRDSLMDFLKKRIQSGGELPAVRTGDEKRTTYLVGEMSPDNRLNSDNKYDGKHRFLILTMSTEDERKEVVDDPLQQAKLLYRELVNAHLNDKLSARLNLNRDTWKFGLLFEPQNLLTVIWLQIAMLADSAKQITRCVVCDNILEIKKRGDGHSPKYCSSACSQKAYRTRLSKYRS